MIQIVQGIVLRVEEQNEFDKRLTLFTKEYGKLRAKITGVKKSASKLKSLTIPFSESRVQLFLAGTVRAGVREPGKIISGEILKMHSCLHADLDRTIQASAMCEILDLLTKDFYPSLKEYEILSNALDELEIAVNPVLVRCRFALLLLKVLGYSLVSHPTWKILRDHERALLKNLALWNPLENIFCKEDADSLQNISSRYLAQYLPFPLKTDQFQQKVSVGV